MKRVLSAALALSLLGGTAAMAQWNDHGGDRVGNGWHGRGADPWAGHQWSRGQRLPREYWGSSYEVRDWNRYHLRRPPRGYHWVRTGTGDYVLAAVATGLIADIIANSH